MAVSRIMASVLFYSPGTTILHMPLELHTHKVNESILSMPRAPNQTGTKYGLNGTGKGQVRSRLDQICTGQGIISINGHYGNCIRQNLTNTKMLAAFRTIHMGLSG